MSGKTYNFPYAPELGSRLLCAKEWHQAVQLRSGHTVQGPNNRWEIVSANPIESLCWSTASNLREKETIVNAIDTAVQKHTSIAQHLTDEFNFLPFCSGAIGLASYDTGAALLGVDTFQDNGKQHRWPDLLVGIYQWSLILDHQHKRCWLFADNKLATQTLDDIRQTLESVNRSTLPSLNEFALTSNWKSSFDLTSYQSAFDQLKRYIAAGDCYQANLTTQYSATYTGQPLHAAAMCRHASPAPFESYLSYQGLAVTSCSPERFIRIKDGTVNTHPIKGTRPRHAEKNTDQRLANELKHSAKDRAENVMIVDLMRNDLGRYCETGSVSVPRLFDIESYSNVHHLVSEIAGRIQANNIRSSLELFFGSIPGGSITGAPKKRAVEIIAELEPHQRSIYCGSVFYLNNNGNLDSNILIRSLLFEGAQAASNNNAIEGTVYCWGGGGIVADSTCNKEWDESLVKINNLLQALSQ